MKSGVLRDVGDGLVRSTPRPEPGTVVPTLAATRKEKDAGNVLFQASDFEAAAAKYCQCVDACFIALHIGNKADRAEWKALLVIACSNAAAACLRLGAPLKAGDFCGTALHVDSSHAKLRARMNEARTAIKKYEVGVLDTYHGENVRTEQFLAEGKYREFLAAARKAAAIARPGHDHVLHAQSLSTIANVTEEAADGTGDEEATVKDVTDAALAVLNVCRPLAGKPGYMLTNTCTGAMPRVEMDTWEAHAWLVLAKVDLDSRSDPAACQDHAIRLLASAEAALPLGAEAGKFADVVAKHCEMAYMLLTRVFVNGGDWAAAAATGGKMLEFVRRFQPRCFLEARARLCSMLMGVAEHWAVGPKPACFDTCSGMMRFAINHAKERGDLKAQADAVHSLLSATRSGREQPADAMQSTVLIAEAGAVIATLASALKEKEAGNVMFRSSDFEGAAAKYCQCVDECVSALQIGNRADRAEWRALLLTACSNAAAACLRLGAPMKAADFCEVALNVDRSRTKIIARLTEACKAAKKWKMDVLDPHHEEDLRAAQFLADNNYRAGVAAARKAAAIARRGRDQALEAKALLRIADLTEQAAFRAGGEEATVEDVTNAALAVLNLRRPLVGKPDYMLTNSGTGVMPRVEMDTYEAKAWLFLSECISIDGWTQPRAGRSCMSTFSASLRAWKRCFLPVPSRKSSRIGWQNAASPRTCSWHARALRAEIRRRQRWPAARCSNLCADSSVAALWRRGRACAEG
jgi:catechol-2,3-dioxygenase